MHFHRRMLSGAEFSEWKRKCPNVKKFRDCLSIMYRNYILENYE